MHIQLNLPSHASAEPQQNLLPGLKYLWCLPKPAEMDSADRLKDKTSAMKIYVAGGNSLREQHPLHNAATRSCGAWP